MLFVKEISVPKVERKRIGDCELGTPVDFIGETMIIIKNNGSTIDAISLDFKTQIRLSSELRLPVAEKIEVSITW